MGLLPLDKTGMVFCFFCMGTALSKSKMKGNGEEEWFTSIASGQFAFIHIMYLFFGASVMTEEGWGR